MLPGRSTHFVFGGVVTLSGAAFLPRTI